MRLAPLVFVLAVVFVLGASRSGRAADPSPPLAQLFPESTVAYAEIASPAKFVEAIYDHPIADKLQNDEKFQPLLATPEYAKFRLGLGVAELTIGMSWRKAVEQLTAGGVAVGFDEKTQGAALVSRAADAESLDRLLKTALKLARDDARNKGQGDPIKTSDYRGATIYQLDRLKLAVSGAWWIATENEALGKLIVDRVVDGGDGTSLASGASFRTARAHRSDKSLVWSCVRLDLLRESGKASGLFRGKAENAAAEMLFGPFLTALQKAEMVTASVDRIDDDFAVRLAMPFDVAWLPEERSYAFGEKGDGRAPSLLRPAGTILNLSTYRDLSAFWNSGPDLFDETANAQLNKANSDLSTLFSGRDFAQDVLGSIRPEWQVVVARQDYRQSVATPDMKLPAGALVVQLREPEKTKREWKVTFQSLIGFLNVVSSMQGQPPLELDSEKVDGIQLVTAAYMPPEAGKKPAPGAIQYNFSPTLAITDTRMVIGSTRQIALDLARSPEGTDGVAKPEVAINSQLAIDVAPLRSVLQDNREQLIARSMLEKGHARIAAEGEVDVLLKLAELVRGLDVRLQRAGKDLELQLRLGL